MATASFTQSESDLGDFFRWGQAWSCNDQGISGNDSGHYSTRFLGTFLPTHLRGPGVTHLEDGPGGDFNWSHNVNLAGNGYFGLDIVDPMFDLGRKEFTIFPTSASEGITRDAPPSADLMICRDHLMQIAFKCGCSGIEIFFGSRIDCHLTAGHNGPVNRGIENPDGFDLVNPRTEPGLRADSAIVQHDWIRHARNPERHMGPSREDIRHAVAGRRETGSMRGGE